MVSDPQALLQGNETGVIVRQLYCQALLAISGATLESYSIGRMAASKLVQELTLLTSQHLSIGEGTDIWRCTRLLRQIIYALPQQTFDEDISPSYFQSEDIQKAVEKLNLRYAQCPSSESTTKKRKVTTSDSNPLLPLFRAIYDTLDIIWTGKEAALMPEETFLKNFANAPWSSQCLALDLLSRISCICDGWVETVIRSAAESQCPVCELGQRPKPLVELQTSKIASRLIFARLIQAPTFLESRQPRVAAMIALRRLATHCEDTTFLDIETLGPGQWCLQSLNSSVRELRVAAGRTIGAFIPKQPVSNVGDDLIARNRKNIIALLKSASDHDPAHLVETRILAWGQLGRVVSEDELNLVLIKLVDYLGSSNNLVSAFTFNELLNLAKAHMIQRPQRSRAIAELLQISVNELLLLVQTHALPWLVLDKRHDVIQKFAEARQEKDTWMQIMDGSNLAATLALLLVQETDDIEKFTKSRLDEISPHFHPQSLLELFRSEPVLIALELFKMAAGADENKRTLAHRALRFVSTTISSTNKDTKSKKGNVIGRVFQHHILGLMARLTDVINDSVSSPPLIMEQRSALATLEEMIKVCKQHVRIARPQEDVEALLETTFLIVRRYWTVLNDDTATIARNMIMSLLDKHGAMVEIHSSKLPPLTYCVGLESVEKTLKAMRPALVMEEALNVFAQRVSHDNSGVVHQALTELAPYLRDSQSALYTSAVSQRPDIAITTILRSLLDCACKYNGSQMDITRLCVQCIGLIGCLDSNQIETVREQRTIVILNNFEAPEEMTDFGLFMLEEVLVPSFLSATDTRLQGFLSYAIQELLDKCEIRAACAMYETQRVGGNTIYRKWNAIPDHAREVMTPFLSSRYMVAPMPPVTVEYPIFHPGKPYGNWLRSFVIGMLREGQHPHADLLFEPLTRVIRVKDLSTAEFLLPYLVMHILLGARSSDDEKSRIVNELLEVLRHQPPSDASYVEREDMKRFCHAVFRCLDYAMRWTQEKRTTGRLSAEGQESVARIQHVLDQIPAELISQRATDCNEYSRALFHLEQHAQKMEQQKQEPGDQSRLLEKLQDIYANIDEPDGLEGISSQLHALDINQQILSHKKAGRWASAQTWYEMQLAENPQNTEVQVDLLNCLKQAGQHDVLLNHIDGMQMNSSANNKILPFAVEAAWVTGRWESLAKFTGRFQENVAEDFNMSVACLFDSLYRHHGHDSYDKAIQSMQDKLASSMTVAATASLNAAHEVLLKCHVLTDLDVIIKTKPGEENERHRTLAMLDGRLEIIGGRFGDKQYLLGIRRAAMELSRPTFADLDISGLWLSSAKLARKSNSLQQSFNAVLHASRLGDDSATIENAKLLWRDNHHRKAIQMLQGAIERNKFMTPTFPSASTGTAGTSRLNSQQKLLTARAQLLLAKWLDAAGQSHAVALREKYQQPPKTSSSWEKGHYYLGRHYKKILEAEQTLKVEDQSDNYVTGEIGRLVIENYVRSLNSGTKYLYQTLPRILTLWLDLGAQVDKAPDGKVSLSRELHRRRVEQLNTLHSFLDKYIYRLPAYIFYTALPQIVARIAHPNTAVFERLSHIITKVVEAHPRQALWSVIGIMTTKQASERKARGAQVLQALRGIRKKVEGTGHDVKSLIRTGATLAEQLLLACQNGDFSANKTVKASLERDLRFRHEKMSCPLVVPVESSLTATLPAVSEHVKKHNAFSRDVVTIDCFLDDVLVLSSLARPRRLTARGSDGKSYMLLIKPKDDLRTDQRLMEFNGIINRSLKRDAESSRRQLYIRTYAVVPLNEECGIIEWVPGIRTMRDILLNLYASRKIHPDYGTLKQLMEDASASESKTRIFTDDVLGRFPPLLPIWFIQQFASPTAWFAARLKYTRSCAVMSMVGTILGLGDRHGENVNLEEGNGGIFHVDFNCLFDKGLTFAKPERVPFRLTHNMVAAMGIYGYEGPFRKSSELTLSILRQQEETLMTILEAFIYDPTLDLQKEKKSSSRRGDASVVRLQPQSVVDSIKRKVRGLLPNESIPLSVEGQVEELIKQAVDPKNLTAMYIGWCPFL
ncbi:serine/threonine-protein kinase M1 [Metarhizium rileyi]|uniref:non-specific serine/threonine protein kinase n=1 Tax=Metarhizium rileyi (strain RCEF 4871) TaxID=1649241 RepID=A0A5C6GBP0_METRR|nr:serine/threonine-protein kinase M1 [Metarhizium rileyi]